MNTRSYGKKVGFLGVTPKSGREGLGSSLTLVRKGKFSCLVNVKRD